MPEMRTIIKRLAEESPEERVKVMVGGAPVNQRFASEINADGYAANAGEAIEVVRSLL